MAALRMDRLSSSSSTGLFYQLVEVVFWLLADFDRVRVMVRQPRRNMTSSPEHLPRLRNRDVVDGQEPVDAVRQVVRRGSGDSCPR